MTFTQLSTAEGERLSRIRNLDVDGNLPSLLIHEEVLDPGKRSSRTHFHSKKQEFIYLLSGELVFCEDDSEVILKKGESIPIPPSDVGHHLENRTKFEAKYISVAAEFLGDKVTFTD